MWNGGVPYRLKLSIDIITQPGLLFGFDPAEGYFADGSRVVALGVYSGKSKATGKSMSSPFAHVWTVRDGRLASFNMYTDTAKVLEAMKH